MFMSENILLNLTVNVLQQDEKKREEWEKRDVLFTDRAVYIFAPVLNEREHTVNYLTSPFERLDMKKYIARNPGELDPTRNNEQPQPPSYSRWLPKQSG